jgi:hypothetical protein
MTRLMLKDRRLLGRNLRYVFPPSLCHFQGSLYVITDNYYQLYSKPKPPRSPNRIDHLRHTKRPIRHPRLTPSQSLKENLTQIITIVSSMVAVCNDTLPPVSAQQSNEILRELSEHTNKLHEVQAMLEVTESRQIMAKSSVTVVNAMKELMKL